MTTLFTSDHEWLRIEGDVATIGITDYAQSQLGDVVFVELPKVGRSLKKAEAAAVVESVKAASDVYAPISGEVLEVNDTITAEPALVNSDAAGKAWFFKVKIADKSELGVLMNEGRLDERTVQTDQRSGDLFRPPSYRPLAARRHGDARDRRREKPRCADERDAAALDPAKGAARSRRAAERDRSARAHERTGRAEPGLNLPDRPGLFRHHSAGRDPAQHPGKPGVVHGLYALSAGDQPGPAGSAVQFPDHDLGPHRARCRQRLAAR